MAASLGSPGCKDETGCQETVEFVRRCRLNARIAAGSDLDKAVEMCRKALRTWPDVQDEIDCAINAAGDCAYYRKCERGVQRTRMLDEAMRLHTAGSWKPTEGWCAIFAGHRTDHPEVEQFCGTLKQPARKPKPQVD